MGKVRVSEAPIDSLSISEQCRGAVLVQKRILADNSCQGFGHDRDTMASGHVDFPSSHGTEEGIFHTEDKTVDAIVSDSEERMSNSSLADLMSDFPGNTVYFGGCALDPYLGNQEIANREITVQPDFVVLQDSYIWDAEIRFSCSSILLTGLNACGCVTARLEWSIDNIVTIEAQWHERVQTAVVWVHVLSDGSSAPDSSGIQQIKFTVSETDWIKELGSIMLLDERYRPLCLWNDHPWPNHVINERLYFPEFNELFDELVYPKDDSDPVTLSKRDLDLLQPETFVNDTIIDFYVKYLKDRLEPEKAQRFHFFNSFFFRKLADLERDQFDASEGRTSFLRVRKWTRKVNLFEKDYIFIPVNSNLHWSLIVICHPGEIAKFEDRNANENHQVPCILHMDSIKGYHAGLKNHLHSYLWEEWKEKQNEATEEIYSKFFNLRFVSLEVPQQENSYDCGLFLLHYVELFLEEAPEIFNPFQITKYSNFLNVAWFPPGDVSIKRAHIQRIIQDINMKCIPDQQRSPCESNYHNGYQKFPKKNNGSDLDVELVRVGCSPPEARCGDLLCEAAQEIERSTLASSSVRIHYLFADDSGLELEFHDQETANQLLNVVDRDFNLESSNSQLKSCVASVEENAGNDDHFVSSLANGAELMTQADQASFRLEDYGLQNQWCAVNSMQAGVEATGNFDRSRSSSRASEDSVIVGVVGNSQVKGVMVTTQGSADVHVGSSPLTENIENLSENPGCPTPMVLEAAGIKMPDKCGQQNDSCSKTDNFKAITHLIDEEQSGEALSVNSQDAGIDTSGPEVLRVSKRARIEPLEDVRYLTRNIVKDALS